MSKKDGTPARLVIRIDVTPDGRDRFQEAADRIGMTYIASLDRLFEWFARQPAGVQAAVLGNWPAAIEAEVARLLLARMDKAAVLKP